MDKNKRGNNEHYEIEKIRQALIKFIKSFQEDPFQYFYEEDVRASLYTLLKTEINIERDYPTKIYSEVLGCNLISTAIVKAEYPSFIRFDIAILSHSDKDDFYNQPVNVAIELKLGSHKLHSDKTAGLKSDINKLKAYQNKLLNESFTGLAIYFCQTEIEKIYIDEWYKDLSGKFHLIEVNQLNFKMEKVSAIIVPVNKTNQIYLLQA